MPGDAEDSELASRQCSPQAADALRRETLIARLVELSPVGLYFIEGGRCTFVNPQLCEITGLTPTAALNGGWFQAVHPDDLPRARAEWMAAAHAGQPFSSEYRCVHPSGRVVWVLSQARAVKGTNNTYVGTLTDISERKAIEQALHEGKQRLNEAQRLANIGSWELDLKTEDLSYTSQVLAIFGLTPADLPPSEALLLSRVHPEDRALVLRARTLVLSGEKPYPIEHRLQMVDGTIKYVAQHGELCVDENGQPSFLRCTIQDVTRQRGAELKLEASETRYRSLVSALSEGIVVYEPNGRATTWNMAAERLLGLAEIALPYNRLNPVGAHAEGIVPKSETHPVIRVLQSGVPEANVIMSIAREDHEPRWVSVNVMPVFDPGRVEPASVVASFVDITARLTTERTLQKSLAEKQLLLSELHHRVKNNLQVISSLLRLQGAEADDPKIQALFSESCQRVRAISTVHDLLSGGDVSRIDFGAYLRVITQQLVNAHHTSALRVEFFVSAESIFLDLRDAVPCGLIVNELLTNALKHAFPDRSSGEVSVSMASGAEGFVLEVADNGVGLPEEVSPSAPKTLGLTLVKALSETLSAELRVQRFRGTRFTLVLSEPYRA